MFKIGIIGTENSHAEAFAEIFNGKNSNIYQDCKVVAVGGHYPESSQNLFEKYNLDFIAEEPEDMIGKVDAVMITARDGKYHSEFAKPFIEAGIPAFIDKPFTINPDEALELAKLANSKNVPICGGSSLKYAYDIILLKNAVESGLGGICGGAISAPLSMSSEHSGFYFYSSHLAEMSLTVFGYNPKSVIAFENKGNVTAIASYDSYNVTNHFMDECYTSYHGIVHGKDRTISREVDISMCYKQECDVFVNMLRSGKMKHSYEELIFPVYYLNAVEKSYKSGVPVEILSLNKFF